MADAPLPTTRVTLLTQLRQDPSDQAARWADRDRAGPGSERAELTPIPVPVLDGIVLEPSPGVESSARPKESRRVGSRHRCCGHQVVTGY